MAKFIKLFATTADYEAYAASSSFETPNVSLCEDAPNTVYYSPAKEKYPYLEFVIKTGGSISFSATTTANTLSYSKDGGNTWNEASGAIQVSSGESIMWKGICSPLEWVGIGKFSGDSNVRYDVQGNAMSLLYGDDFEDKTSLEGKDYAFENLFSGNTNVVNAEDLILPATTLANECYNGMFGGCTSLTEAPQLPATTLAKSCYVAMFSGCTNLSAVPQLPATTLAEGCYIYMFRGCTSLTEAPQLQATTLAIRCYYSMFYGCTNLTTAPELPATTLENYCYQGMFANCTSLTTAPQLPATTLASNCYNSMFRSCTKLSAITCLATNISASNCTTNWVSGVSASGTFTKAASMTSWTSGASGIPSGWSVADA